MHSFDKKSVFAKKLTTTGCSGLVIATIGFVNLFFNNTWFACILYTVVLILQLVCLWESQKTEYNIQTEDDEKITSYVQSLFIYLMLLAIFIIFFLDQTSRLFHLPVTFNINKYWILAYTGILLMAAPFVYAYKKKEASRHDKP